MATSKRTAKSPRRDKFAPSGANNVRIISTPKPKGRTKK